MADLGDAVQRQVRSIESQVNELKDWCDYFSKANDSTWQNAIKIGIESLGDKDNPEGIFVEITPPYAKQAKVFGEFLRDLYAKGADFPNGVHTEKNAVRDTLRKLFDADPNFFFYTLFTQRNNLQLLLQSGHVKSKNIKSKFDDFAEFDPITAILIAVRITSNDSWKSFFGGTKKANNILQNKINIDDWMKLPVNEKATKILQLLVHPNEGADTIETLVKPGDYQSFLAFYLAVIKYFRLVRHHLDAEQQTANDAVIKTVINDLAPLDRLLKNKYNYSECAREFPKGLNSYLSSETFEVDVVVLKDLLRELYEQLLTQEPMDYDAINDLFKFGLDLDFDAWLALRWHDSEFAEQQFDRLVNKFIGKYFAGYKIIDKPSKKELNQRQIIFALKIFKWKSVR